MTTIEDPKICEAINQFKNRGGVLRTTEALTAGIHPRTLYNLRDEGVIIRLERGLYKLNDDKPLSNPDLVIIAAKIPSAKICMLSALDFHGLTKEIPHRVHIAIARSQRDPKIDHPPLQVYRFSDESLNVGVEKHSVDGQTLQVYNPAKTIADCFKFRNQIGKEIAIEALREGIRLGKASYKDIIRYAGICRVETVIKPYMEALVHD